MESVFKILFFGDVSKDKHLEKIDWNRSKYELLTVREVNHVFDLVQDQNPQVVLVDYDLANLQVIPFLETLITKISNSSIIGVTDIGHMDLVVQSVKLGVRDVIHLKDEPYKLPKTLEKMIDTQIVHQEGDDFHKVQKDKYDFHNIVGQSQEMRSIFQLISRIKRQPSVTILLLGETGTGKEMIARAIHYKSYEHNRPFVEINCNTLPENLLESELFGYEKGAFTDAKTQKIGLFEMAHNGTLFLDEIGEISPAIQLKLLRAIETKRIRRLGGTKDISIETRIIAATSRDLQKAKQREGFRDDLYYRLNVFTIHLPALRERGDDILLLAKHFLEEFTEEYHSPILGFEPEAETLLKGYYWPGNVRELKHSIERIVLLSDDQWIRRKTLEETIEWEEEFKKNIIFQEEKEILPLKIDLPVEGMSLENSEKLLIRAVLEKEGWNKTKTCKYLNISRPRLDRKIEKYNIDPGMPT